MTTISEVFEAGVDALVADSTLNKGGVADAIRSVITQGFSNAEATAWIDAIATEYNRVGQINNGTYSSLRSKINSDGKDLAMIRFNAVTIAISVLPETVVAFNAMTLVDLRAERDEADANIDILVALKSGQPRQVKDAIQLGVDQLRGHKQAVRDQIQNLTGDPDS